jgi:hypothetical protein
VKPDLVQDISDRAFGSRGSREIHSSIRMSGGSDLRETVEGPTEPVRREFGSARREAQRPLGNGGNGIH